MRSSTQSPMILCYSSGFPCLPWWFNAQHSCRVLGDLVFCRRLFNTQQSLNSRLFNTQQSSNRRLFNTQQSYALFSRGWFNLLAVHVCMHAFLLPWCFNASAELWVCRRLFNTQPRLNRRLFNTQQSKNRGLFNTQQRLNRRLFNTQQSYALFSRGWFNLLAVHMCMHAFLLPWWFNAQQSCSVCRRLFNAQHSCRVLGDLVFCRRLFNTQQSLDSRLFNTQQSSNRRLFNTQQSYSLFSRGWFNLLAVPVCMHAFLLPW
jgi:hypothetical protein